MTRRELKIAFNYILILGFSAIFLYACGAKQETNNEEVVDEKLSEQEQQQQIYDEVMGLHDELMPQMKNLFDMRSALIEKADSLDQAGESSDELRQTIAELEAGEEAMMQWMRNFENLPEDTPHDSVINYMTDQREKIMQVKEMMENAMAAGKSAGGN